MDAGQLIEKCENIVNNFEPRSTGISYGKKVIAEFTKLTERALDMGKRNGLPPDKLLQFKDLLTGAQVLDLVFDRIIEENALLLAWYKLNKSLDTKPLDKTG